jgi:hypothetical protein
LTPEKIGNYKAEFNDRILGSDEFWESRRGAQFLTMVSFGNVELIGSGPRMDPHHMKAWQVLPNDRDVYPKCLAKKENPAGESRSGVRTVDATTLGAFPIRCVLTSGNLKNNHVYLNDAAALFPAQCQGGATRADAGRPVTLRFDDGTEIETDVVRSRGLFRARAPWGKWFRSRRARVGDTVEIDQRGDRHYAVRLKRKRD